MILYHMSESLEEGKELIPDYRKTRPWLSPLSRR